MKTEKENHSPQSKVVQDGNQKAHEVLLTADTWNLSDEIKNYGTYSHPEYIIKVEKVAEFIRRLKERIEVNMKEHKRFSDKRDKSVVFEYLNILRFVEKLAGDKLK